MVTRILPETEWSRLAGTEVESIVPGLDPQKCAVVVVEDDGKIIGTWVLLMMAHVECFWIAPDHRKRGGVAARLLRSMRSVLRQYGITAAPITASMTTEMSEMIARLGGVKLPGEHFALSLETGKCPQ